jgi:outer membrane protein TolC
VGSQGTGELGIMTMIGPARMFMLPPDPFASESLVFQWALFSSGRARAVSRVGEMGVRIGDAGVRRARLDVAYRVRSAFAEAAYRRDAIRGYRAGWEAAEEMEKLTRARYEEGKIPEAFVFAAEAQTAKARRDLRVAEAEYESALAQLREALGGGLGEPFEIGEWQDAVLPDTLERALDLAYSLRPELLSIAYEREKAGSAAEAVRRSLLPEVRLFGVQTGATGRSMAPDSSYHVGVLLSVPLFDGLMRSAEARRADSEAAKAAAMLESERLAVEAEVRSAWAKWRAVEDVLAFAEAQFRAAEEAYRIAKLRFDVGKAVHAEVSVVLADLIAAQVSLADAHRYKRKAEAELIRAIGLEPEREKLSNTGG